MPRSPCRPVTWLGVRLPGHTVPRSSCRPVTQLGIQLSGHSMPRSPCHPVTRCGCPSAHPDVTRHQLWALGPGRVIYSLSLAHEKLPELKTFIFFIPSILFFKKFSTKFYYSYILSLFSSANFSKFLIKEMLHLTKLISY